MTLRTVTRLLYVAALALSATRCADGTGPFVDPAPVISLLPVRGATAGGGGFDLTIHGRNFRDGARVSWNGSPREARVLDGGRIRFAVSPTDVAAPDLVSLSVVNPDGSESEPAALAVRGLESGPADVREIALRGRDLVWDSVSARLYVSVEAPVGGGEGRTVAVDPLHGTITRSVPVTRGPSLLALSDDGRVLYVSLDDPGGVRRFDLPSLTPTRHWPVNGVPIDLEVVPGQSDTVVVTHESAVIMYEDGGVIGAVGFVSGRLEFLQWPDVLYCFNNRHTPFEFLTMAVDEHGLAPVAEVEGLIVGFDTDIVGESGRIYASNGTVVDAERRARVGTFLVGGASVAVDPDAGRAHFLTADGIETHDLNTYRRLGSIPIAVDLGGRTRIVRWGTDGLAFLDRDSLVLVRSPLIR